MKCQKASDAAILGVDSWSARMRAIFKLLLFLLTAVVFFLVMTPLYFPMQIWPHSTRIVVFFLLTLFNYWLCFFMGIKIKVSGEREDIESAKNEGSLLVSNHMSYLDAVIYAKTFCGSFVTSMEMKEMPFLGQITQVGGCLYVERRNKSNLSNEVKELTESLRHKNRVIVFPEATSTNGEEVIRFRRPLYRAAVDANAPIRPMTLNYRRVSGLPVTKENRDFVCWYDDMTFFDHLMNFFKQTSFEVEIYVHPVLETKDFEDHTELANLTHEIVSSKYDPIS